MTSLLIALGGALGSLARYWVSEALALALGPAFPWGTLIVNITGSFLIGLAAGGSIGGTRTLAVPFVRHFVMVGICGGYTTFSAFSLQTVSMLQTGDVGRASLNVAASVTTCLAATWAGYLFAGAISA